MERPIDQGILEVLRSDIVPRLLQDVPGQPTDEQLQADKYRFRFVLVFDRAAYSPPFFKEMWQKHRIACITYHKHPKEDWPQERFEPTQVHMPNGETLCISLAEMGSWVGDRRDGLWMREIRKLTTGGRQTSLISSAYRGLGPSDAARLFSRWVQENFFRYMMEHYAIDLLSDYETEEIPGTNQPVINPSWRELDRERRSQKGKLQQQQARFGALTSHPETDQAKMPQWEKRKAELLEEIQQLEEKLKDLNQRSEGVPKHLDWEKLPQSEKFRRLAPSRKRLMDTVKMVAYRAETAMMAIVREVLARPDDARALVRDLYRTEADIQPDVPGEVLHVRVHTMSNPRSNRAVAHLLEQLNAAELTYPGTRLNLTYSLAAPPPPQ